MTDTHEFALVMLVALNAASIVTFVMFKTTNIFIRTVTAVIAVYGGAILALWLTGGI